MAPYRKAGMFKIAVEDGVRPGSRVRRLLRYGLEWWLTCRQRSRGVEKTLHLSARRTVRRARLARISQATWRKAERLERQSLVRSRLAPPEDAALEYTALAATGPKRRKIIKNRRTTALDESTDPLEEHAKCGVVALAAMVSAFRSIDQHTRNITICERHSKDTREEAGGLNDLKVFLANPYDESNPLFGTDQDYARSEIKEMEDVLHLAGSRVKHAQREIQAQVGVVREREAEVVQHVFGVMHDAIVEQVRGLDDKFFQLLQESHLGEPKCRQLEDEAREMFRQCNTHPLSLDVATLDAREHADTSWHAVVARKRRIADLQGRLHMAELWHKELSTKLNSEIRARNRRLCALAEQALVRADLVPEAKDGKPVVPKGLEAEENPTALDREADPAEAATLRKELQTARRRLSDARWYLDNLRKTDDEAIETGQPESVEGHKRFREGQIATQHIEEAETEYRNVLHRATAMRGALPLDWPELVPSGLETTRDSDGYAPSFDAEMKASVDRTKMQAWADEARSALTPPSPGRFSTSPTTAPRASSPEGIIPEDSASQARFAGRKPGGGLLDRREAEIESLRRGRNAGRTRSSGRGFPTKRGTWV